MTLHDLLKRLTELTVAGGASAHVRVQDLHDRLSASVYTFHFCA